MNRFIWLIRRELWEARAVWIAPAICAGIVVGGAVIAALASHPIGFGMDTAQLADMHEGLTSDKLDAIAGVSLAGVAVPFFIMLMFTQFFYSIDALFGERRERSILFWKSLPVSDAETVLSKLAIGAVVMPAVATAAAFIAQIGVCAAAAAKLSAVSGLQGHLWSPAVWGDVLLLDLYVMATSMLWCVPLVAFQLLVSAAAPRAPVAIAILMPLAAAFAEWLVFRTHYVLRILMDRSVGGLAMHIFTAHPRDGFGVHVDSDTMDLPHSLLSMMRPLDFLGSVDLWAGLAVGAALIAAAVWTRRYRDATY